MSAYLKIRALIKYVCSDFKSEWDLYDYPIRIRHQKINNGNHSGRLTPIPWTASIINWFAMTGYGNTEQEALSELRDKFNKILR